MCKPKQKALSRTPRWLGRLLSTSTRKRASEAIQRESLLRASARLQNVPSGGRRSIASVPKPQQIGRGPGSTRWDTHARSNGVGVPKSNAGRRSLHILHRKGPERRSGLSVYRSRGMSLSFRFWSGDLSAVRWQVKAQLVSSLQVFVPSLTTLVSSSRDLVWSASERTHETGEDEGELKIHPPNGPFILIWKRFHRRP
jgi:hypothetical protein